MVYQYFFFYYFFVDVQSDELSCERGDILYLLEKVGFYHYILLFKYSLSSLFPFQNDSWWKAKCSEKQGLIPSSFSEFNSLFLVLVCKNINSECSIFRLWKILL